MTTRDTQEQITTSQMTDSNKGKESNRYSQYRDAISNLNNLRRYDRAKGMDHDQLVKYSEYLSDAAELANRDPELINVYGHYQGNSTIGPGQPHSSQDVNHPYGIKNDLKELFSSSEVDGRVTWKDELEAEVYVQSDDKVLIKTTTASKLMGIDDIEFPDERLKQKGSHYLADIKFDRRIKIKTARKLLEPNPAAKLIGKYKRQMNITYSNINKLRRENEMHSTIPYLQETSGRELQGSCFMINYYHRGRMENIPIYVKERAMNEFVNLIQIIKIKKYKGGLIWYEPEFKTRTVRTKSEGVITVRCAVIFDLKTKCSWSENSDMSLNLLAKYGMILDRTWYLGMEKYTVFKHAAKRKMKGTMDYDLKSAIQLQGVIDECVLWNNRSFISNRLDTDIIDSQSTNIDIEISDKTENWNYFVIEPHVHDKSNSRRDKVKTRCLDAHSESLLKRYKNFEIVIKSGEATYHAAYDVYTDPKDRLIPRPRIYGIVNMEDRIYIMDAKTFQSELKINIEAFCQVKAKEEKARIQQEELEEMRKAESDQQDAIGNLTIRPYQTEDENKDEIIQEDISSIPKINQTYSLFPDTIVGNMMKQVEYSQFNQNLIDTGAAIKEEMDVLRNQIQVSMTHLMNDINEKISNRAMNTSYEQKDMTYPTILQDERAEMWARQVDHMTSIHENQIYNLRMQVFNKEAENNKLLMDVRKKDQRKLRQRRLNQTMIHQTQNERIAVDEIKDDKSTKSEPVINLGKRDLDEIADLKDTEEAASKKISDDTNSSMLKNESEVASIELMNKCLELTSLINEQPEEERKTWLAIHDVIMAMISKHMSSAKILKAKQELIEGYIKQVKIVLERYDTKPKEKAIKEKKSLDNVEEESERSTPQRNEETMIVKEDDSIEIQSKKGKETDDKEKAEEDKKEEEKE